ncbi:unnamed protein product [Plutella xylostella]|uniref:(diamondback moth) hypothetical protein n=1 Tax=Plutella xylostella TaxID=51655 RepID=A0A8S4FZL4_PLUXY|nr:unnamed protein product [Plutella xylostella]
MASKKIFFVIFLVYLSKVESASLFERSYEYVMNIGKNLAPSFMTMLDCMGEEDAWGCAKTKAGILLDAWGQDLNKQRRSWQVFQQESRTRNRSGHGADAEDPEVASHRGPRRSRAGSAGTGGFVIVALYRI